MVVRASDRVECGLYDVTATAVARVAARPQWGASLAIAGHSGLRGAVELFDLDRAADRRGALVLEAAW